MSPEAPDFAGRIRMGKQMARILVNPFLRAALIAAAVSLCVNGLFVAVEWYAVSPHGSEAGLFWGSLVVVVGLLIALAGVPVSLIAAVSSKARRSALLACLCCLAYLLVGVGCIRIGDRVRMHAFHGLAERSAGLVAAIKRFEAERGNPPTTLQDLVPDFLPHVPKTGMGAYPDYEYLVGEKARPYAGNPWVLVVSTPSGGINFDMFVYFPNGDYPREAYGSWLERISDWAYCHE
jgi:hypothetical protein